MLNLNVQPTYERVMLMRIFMICLLMLTSCTKPKVETDPEYKKTIDEWHQRRSDRLLTETGWLNLVGLEWLKQGKNTIGSDPSSDVRLPADRAPAYCGTMELNGRVVTLHADKNADIRFEGKNVSDMELGSDADSITTVLELGSLRFFIIQRGEQTGVRIRDLQSPLLKAFKGIERFPVDKNWRLEATLEPYDPPKIIPVPTILNTIDSSRSPGAIRFEIDGKTYRLDAIAESGSDEYFMIVGDKTNGDQTYGGGRYIYIPKADSLGRTVIDFNKLYNPPCVFTSFATCPFPPLQNRLPIAIPAGEKTYGHH